MSELGTHRHIQGLVDMLLAGFNRELFTESRSAQHYAGAPELRRRDQRVVRTNRILGAEPRAERCFRSEREHAVWGNMSREMRAGYSH